MAICGICTLPFYYSQDPSDASADLVPIYFFAMGNAIVLVLPIAIVFVDIFIVVVVMQMIMAIGKL